MNNRILELLKEAGFVFWQNEPWGPGPGRVDWSMTMTERSGIL